MDSLRAALSSLFESNGVNELEYAPCSCLYVIQTALKVVFYDMKMCDVYESRYRLLP